MREPAVCRVLRSDELVNAARLLGRAMRDNPINVRALGENAEHRERALSRFFDAVLRGASRRALILGAFEDASLVAVSVLAEPGACGPPLREKLEIIPSIVLGSSLITTVRVLKWTGEWAARDLREAHWHLGPLAVEAALQGRGIGSVMMTEVCARMDEQHAVLYLETDKRENVRFYERFGFIIREELCVLGVPNWFMSREAVR